MRDQIVRVKRFEKVPLILVGNKVDLESEREVAGSDGRALAQEWGCPFIETSAKSKSMVDELFAEIVRQMNYTTLPEKQEQCCTACVVQWASWPYFQSRYERAKPRGKNKPTFRLSSLFTSHWVHDDSFFQNVQNIEICFISLHKIVVYDLIYTLTGHFIRYTLLVPGWTHFCLQNCLNYSWHRIDSTRYWKHSSEI